MRSGCHRALCGALRSPAWWLAWSVPLLLARFARAWSNQTVQYDANGILDVFWSSFTVTIAISCSSAVAALARDRDLLDLAPWRRRLSFEASVVIVYGLSAAAAAWLLGLRLALPAYPATSEGLWLGLQAACLALACLRLPLDPAPTAWIHLLVFWLKLSLPDAGPHLALALHAWPASVPIAGSLAQPAGAMNSALAADMAFCVAALLLAWLGRRAPVRQP